MAGEIPDRIVPMRVIVCGVQRTGTLSTSLPYCPPLLMAFLLAD